MKTALITGVTGQDGSYLAEFLLSKDYRVVGMVRRASIDRFERIEHLRERIELIQGDLTDQTSLDEAVRNVQPDEVYNFAAQSFVPTSWNQPVMTGDVTGLAVTRILEAVREKRQRSRTKRQCASDSARPRWAKSAGSPPAAYSSPVASSRRPKVIRVGFVATRSLSKSRENPG